MLVPLLRERRFIFLFVAAATVLSVIAAFVIPKRYTAHALVLPPSQSQSSATMLLGQLGSLASLGAGAKDLGLKNPADLYVGILHSRTMADSLINQFHLQDVYGKKRYSDTRKKLDKNTEVAATKEGMISIEVTDREAERAAALANAYVQELQKLSNTLAVTEASQRRVFFEQQLQQAKDQLADAEIALKQTQEKTGVLEISSQSRAMIEAVANLKAQIAAKDVRIQSMRGYVTGENPELIQQQNERAALQVQLERLMKQQPESQGDIEIPTRQIPQIGMEYIRRYRDVKYHETVYGLIAKQYETARLDEAREAGLIQVVDNAVVPDRKSWPPRTGIIAAGFLLSGLLASLIVLGREAAGRLHQGEFGNELQRAWKGSRFAA